MDDPQEYKSLDELFHKTFNELPEQAAATGWDTPSPRVWDQVRDQIQPPKSGWTGKSILLISGLAIVLLLGLYWAMTRPGGGAPVEPTEQQAAVASTDSSQADLVIEAQATTPAQSAGTNTGTSQTKKQLQSNSGTNLSRPESTTGNYQPEDVGFRRQLPGSAPLPGTKPVSPNTTIRRQMELWRGAPWAQPLAPMPTILESTIIRPVPEGLKNLYKPN